MLHSAAIAGTDTVFEVRDDEPILDAALRAGVRVPYSCRQGTCRTCLSHVSEGDSFVDADPDDVFIDDDEVEDGWRLLCVTRCRSDIVLDDGAILP
jgi:2Fe-2S type ferredoxin